MQVWLVSCYSCEPCPLLFVEESPAVPTSRKKGLDVLRNQVAKLFYNRNTCMQSNEKQIVTSLVKSVFYRLFISLKQVFGITFTVRLLKLGPPRQWKPIRWQNQNNRFKHFQIQPGIKCLIFKSGQSNARYKTMKSQLVRSDALDYGVCAVNCQIVRKFYVTLL